jgi:hypothetical protein
MAIDPDRYTGDEVVDGPFTWKKQKWADADHRESWELFIMGKRSADVLGTYWHLTDYGRHDRPESDCWSGWRFGSGGPFTDAGRWRTLAEATVGCREYIIRDMRRVLRAKRRAAARIELAMAELVTQLGRLEKS